MSLRGAANPMQIATGLVGSDRQLKLSLTA
jgi:hypothetical protein